MNLRDRIGDWLKVPFTAKRVIEYLIMLVLLIEVPRFFGAYDAIDPKLLGVPFTAYATGVLLPVGTAIVFNTWWKATRSRRVVVRRKGTRRRKVKSWHNLLLVPFGANVILGPFILTPWGLAQLRQQSLDAVLGIGFDVAWVIAVMSSPYILVTGLAMSLAFQKEEKKQSDKNTSSTEEKEPERRKLEPRLQAMYDRMALEYAGRQFTRIEMQSFLGVGESTASKLLQDFKREGVVVSAGNGKNTTYSLNGH